MARSTCHICRGTFPEWKLSECDFCHHLVCDSELCCLDISPYSDRAGDTICQKCQDDEGHRTY